MASKVRHRVITLVMEAQGRCWWASFSKSTWPVEASISTAEGAVTSSPSALAGKAGRSRAAAVVRAKTPSRIFFMGIILSRG